MAKKKGTQILDKHDMDNICLLKDKGFSTRQIMDITGKSKTTINNFFSARTRLVIGDIDGINYLPKRHIDYWSKKLDIAIPEDVHKEEKPFDALKAFETFGVKIEETEKLRADEAYQDEVARYLLNNGERLVNTGNLLTSIGEQLKDLSKVLSGEKDLHDISYIKPVATQKQKDYIINLAAQLNEPVAIQDIKTYEQANIEIRRLLDIRDSKKNPGWFQTFIGNLGGKENE